MMIYALPLFPTDECTFSMHTHNNMLGIRSEEKPKELEDQPTMNSVEEMEKLQKPLQT